MHAEPALLLKLADGKCCLRAEDDLRQWDLEYLGLDSIAYAPAVFSSLLLAPTAGIEVQVPFRRRGGAFLVEARGQYVFGDVLGPSQGMDFQMYGVLLMVG